MLEVTKKRVLVPIVLILVIIEIACCFLLWKGNSGKETLLEEVKLKEEIKDNGSLAIKVEQSDGTYTDYYDIPLKEDGYIFNNEKSGCLDADGNKVQDILSYRNNMVKVDVKGTTFCYLYFDLISDGDFCIDQGITDLSDCLLVMEDYSYDTGEAIDYINDKGSVTTSKIAPTVTFQQSSTNKTGSIVSFSSNIAVGKSYSFNTTTGLYSLKDYSTVTISDDYIGYYTCGSTSTSGCTTLYKINDYSVTTSSASTTYTITDADVYTYKTLDSFDSEVGLYATTDDDGTTYFYRGAVKNNYVSFGGYIWRVIRINGNGTVRMIYAGTSTSATGADASIGTSQYNSKYWDPTYVGYKYSDSNMPYYENQTLTTYTNMQSSYKYCYSKSFTTNATNRTFQLSQVADETICGTWSETYSKALSEGYIYTLFNTSTTSTHYRVFKLDSYVNATQAKGYYISYNSPNYASTLQNETDSTIKTKIDTWYASNIVGKTDANGKAITDYISDEVFCNDRSIHSGSGYLMSPTTYYKPYQRIANQFAPSLSCSQDSDKFSVSNGNLTYPVALITIDEASLAGGRTSNVNDQYYLYTGQTYWTMSPSVFYEWSGHAYVWHVFSTGQLDVWGYVSATIGVRPVINLKSDVSITQGTGTASNPYVLTYSGN